MKKVAIVTVAVLALGLAACNKNNADNNAANETAVENTASTDVNAASNDGQRCRCRAQRRQQGSRTPATRSTTRRRGHNATENK